MSKLVSLLYYQLFPSGGEAHTYEEIVAYAEAALGISERSVRGIVGFWVAQRMLEVATYATAKRGTIFVR